MRSGRVDLPLATLAGVVARTGPAPLQLVLRPEPMWIPDAEHKAFQCVVDKELAAAGLVDGRGRVDAEFLDWLPVLTNASIEYYGWFWQGEMTWSVLTAARGLLGLVAVRRSDRVTLLSVSQNELAEAFVNQLPELVPGGGAPRSVCVLDLEEAARYGGHARAMPAEVGEIVKVIERPVTGGGELYVAERDETGRYRRLEEPLHYVDTDWGRYLNYTMGAGTDTQIHIAPGGPTAIALALEQARARTTCVEPAVTIRPVLPGGPVRSTARRQPPRR